MPRVCTICTHPRRVGIEAALVTGTSYRVIVRQFGVSHDAIQRHALDHVRQRIAAHQDARDEAQALNVVKQLRTINGAALTILKDAHETGDHDLALKAIDRVQRQIELQAKLLGDLDDRAQVTVSVEMQQHKHYIVRQIQVALDAVLPDDPEVRERFTEKLLEMDAAEEQAKQQNPQQWRDDGYGNGRNGHHRP